ncbi:CinA family protein [Pontibaca methylaminivorans]|uniref:CinA family protein n=1 Tax=Pontibaca methylaminivorans TaxID=515897 RepID=UPI002FD90B72
MTVPSEILTRARAAGLRVASAESCTGGLVAAALTSVPGSSHMFERGFVTYSNDSKRELLGVRDGTLERYGAVSEEVAREMAEGALARSGADVAVSTTGIAGPGASEHKPEGRVCFGTARKGKPTRSETVDYGAIGRETVRARSCEHALALLLAALR